jgi:hypothetical protein
VIHVQDLTRAEAADAVWLLRARMKLPTAIVLGVDTPIGLTVIRELGPPRRARAWHRPQQ